MNILSEKKFFEKFGELLVKADNDNVEFGDYLFLHPEDVERVKSFDDDKHQIVSVHESENGNLVDMESPCSIGDNNPFKYGYYVIEKPFN
jgi:hypothetical protein